MADYEVGNILVSLETTSQDTIDSLNKVEKQLSVFSKRLKEVEKINIAKVELSLERISKFKFNNIVKAFSPLQNLDSKSITSFGSAIRSIDKITNLSKVSVDFEKIEENVKKLTIAVDPFVQKMIQAEPSLRAFSNALDLQKVNGQLMVAEARVKAINSKAQSKKVLDDIKIEKANIQLEKTKNKLDEINQKSLKTSKTFGNIFNLGKIYFLFNYTKRFVSVIANAMKKSIDFNETLNKFQVSMGNYYSDSIKFVNKITYAFNLSTESIMNYMSTFKNMLDALGDLETGVSYELSESLTQMAIDYASLFNVSVDKAMQQFQSVLSGQIRSIRTTSGYDVSEATIFNIYQQLGGTKTMRQLTQLEKRLLRIVAVQQQLERTGAVGDFAKTINESANLLKQISETLIEIGRWFGQLTMVYLKPFLTNLLGGLIAIREILKSLNIAQGYQYDNFTEGLFGKTEENIEDTEKAVESLKRSLLGFDKLNVLGSSSNNSNILGSDVSLITEAIKKYESNMEKVKNQANEVSERILAWLGYTKEINIEFDEAGKKVEQIVWTLNDGVTKIEVIGFTLKTILITLTAIKTKALLIKLDEILFNKKLFLKMSKFKSDMIGMFLLIKEFGLKSTMTTFFPSLGSNLSAIVSSGTKIFALLGKIALVAGAIAGLIAIMTYLYKTNANFKASVDDLLLELKNLWNTLQSTFKIIVDNLVVIVKQLTPIISQIVTLFSNILQSLMPIITTLVETIGNVLKALTPILTEIINNLVQSFGDFLASITPVVTFLVKVANVLLKIFNALMKVYQFFTFQNLFKNSSKNISVPKLASGGVITKPTMAMVGEYSGARSNPEIVTPESKMRQVMLETTVPLMQAILNGNRELVTTIKNNPTILYVDSTKLAETTYNAYENTARRLGKNNLVFNN